MSKHPASDLTSRLAENVPSNVQMEKGIEQTKQVLQEEIAKRGTTVPEYKLAKDTTELLTTTQQFIHEKNKGELLQKFLQDASDAVDEISQQFNSQQFFIQRRQFMIKSQVPIQDITQTAKINAEALKNLGLTLLNSSEFRLLLNDFVDLVQSMVRTEQLKTGSLPSLTPSTDTTVPLTEEAKAKAQQTLDIGQQVFQDIKEGKLVIPEDRKQLVWARLRSLIDRLNYDTNFQSATNGLFQLFDQIQYWSLQLKEQAKQQVSQVQLTQGSALWRMWDDSKQMMVKWVPEQHMNKFYNDISGFYNLVWSDERLTQFFWDFRSFIVDVIQNPSLLDTEEYKQRWNNLYNYSYVWMNDPKYRQSLNSIYADFYLILDTMKADQLTTKLTSDLSRIARDVVLDESGQPSLQIMGQGLNNLRTLVAPILRKYLENVAVPGFSGSDETYDWQIEGMYLNASTLIPDNIEVKVWGDAKISLTDQSSKAATYITMWIRDIGLAAKDLKYHFKRKGAISLDESGICDFLIDPKGSRIKIVWRIVGEQNQPWLWSIYQVNCSLGDVDITIKESTHTYLMKFLSTIFSGRIRRNIEDKIESTIIEGLGSVNDQLNATVQTLTY